MTDYLNVGKIVNTQGIKGEVRVISQTDFAEERYQKGNKLMLFQEKQAPIEITIKSHRKHKNFDIISFENHPTINDVEKYRDAVLKVAMEALHDLATDEFYYHEIIGLKVTEGPRELGVITEILSPGANDVWVVKPARGKEIYVPYIESVVKTVDLEAGEVQVELPEGLVDDED